MSRFIRTNLLFFLFLSNFHVILSRMSLNENVLNKFTQIKSFRTSRNGASKFTISAGKFSQFETDLFELLGIQNTPFKPNEVDDNSQPTAMNCDMARSKLVADMSKLERGLELNAFNKVQMKKPFKREAAAVRPSAKYSNMPATVDEQLVNENQEFRSKVITVILNRPTRPRPAGRLLLTKKNSSNLDSVLNEIANMFKANAAQIRKLFNLKATQVRI